MPGAARQYREKGDGIVTLATEHGGAADVHALEQEGFRVTIVPVRPTGSST
jgi:cysteine sulfinate desulfinase/cysteine desulfurase-like protein